MGRQVFLFELDGERVMGFDTGLDSRAFARAKLAQLVTEHGLIVSPAGNGENLDGKQSSVELWKASGVVEYSAPGCDGEPPPPPTMVVWGPAFEGERLDLIVNDSDRQDEALSAVALWLRAVLALEENSRASIPFWPCAAIVAGAGSGESGPSRRVFFAPPSLALRCLRAGEESLHFSGYEWYVHPDFGGTADVVHDQHEASLPAHLARQGFGGRYAKARETGFEKTSRRTAFTAAAMLYRVFAGTVPFPATNDIELHQDVRDGNFLPVRLAVPGLDPKLADLIQRVLEPHEKKNAITGNPMKKPLPAELLSAVQLSAPGDVSESGEASSHTGLASPVSSLVLPVSEADMQVLEKEKRQFLKVKTASVNTKRFVIRNAGILLAGLAGLVVAVFFIGTIVNSRAARPTSAGMEPAEVVKSYYGAFGELNHTFMENIVMRGVGRNDITMVVNLFVINRVRMAHEFSPTPLIIPATEWKETGGGATDLAVFGVTDLQIEQMERIREIPGQRRRRARRSSPEDEVHFRVDYLFWVPAQMLGGAPDTRADMRQAGEAFEPPPPVSFRHTDLVSLVRNRHGNWVISDITRVVRY